MWDKYDKIWYAIKDKLGIIFYSEPGYEKKVKKIQVSRFINTALKLDSESDLDSDLEKMEAKIDNELEAGSDNDSVYDVVNWFFKIFCMNYLWLLITVCDYL